MNYPLTVLLSFFSGLLSELIAWVMLFHQLSPKNHGWRNCNISGEPNLWVNHRNYQPILPCDFEDSRLLKRSKKYENTSFLSLRSSLPPRTQRVAFIWLINGQMRWLVGLPCWLVGLPCCLNYEFGTARKVYQEPTGSGVGISSQGRGANSRLYMYHICIFIFFTYQYLSISYIWCM